MNLELILGIVQCVIAVALVIVNAMDYIHTSKRYKELKARVQKLSMGGMRHEA